jgi:hypothetical protein
MVYKEFIQNKSSFALAVQTPVIMDPIPICKANTSTQINRAK